MSGETRVDLRVIDDVLLERVRQRIVEACQPAAVYLIGSAARQQARPGSDLDLVVVMDPPAGRTPRDVAREIHALFEGWMLPLDIVVLSPQAFRRGATLPGHIAWIVRREGVLLGG